MLVSGLSPIYLKKKKWNLPEKRDEFVKKSHNMRN